MYLRCCGDLLMATLFSGKVALPGADDQFSLAFVVDNDFNCPESPVAISVGRIVTKRILGAEIIYDLSGDIANFAVALRKEDSAIRAVGEAEKQLLIFLCRRFVIGISTNDSHKINHNFVFFDCFDSLFLSNQRVKFLAVAKYDQNLAAILRFPLSVIRSRDYGVWQCVVTAGVEFS